MNTYIHTHKHLTRSFVVAVTASLTGWIVMTGSGPDNLFGAVAGGITGFFGAAILSLILGLIMVDAMFAVVDHRHRTVPARNCWPH